MEWDEERGWGVYDDDDSPRRYRRLQINKSQDKLGRESISMGRLDRTNRSQGRSIDKLDRSVERLDRTDRSLGRLNKSQGRSMDTLDRSVGGMDRSLGKLNHSHGRSMDTLDRSVGRVDRKGRSVDRLDRSQGRSMDKLSHSPRRSRKRQKKGSRGKINKSRDKSLGRSIDKSLDRSFGRSVDRSLDRSFGGSLGDLDRSLDLSLHRLDRIRNISPGTSPKQYRQEDISRSLDMLLDESPIRSPNRANNRSMEILLGSKDRRREVGGSPEKSREVLDQNWVWSQESLDKLGVRSPGQEDRWLSESRSQDALDKSGGRQPGQGRPEGRGHRHNTTIRPTKSRQKATREQKKSWHMQVFRTERSGRGVEVALIWLHALTVLVTLIGVGVLGVMATKWQMQRNVCPLFVTIPPGFYIHWGNEDLTSCNIAAFLPLMVVALSLLLAGLHFGVVKAWQKDTKPMMAASRGLAVVLLVVAVIEAAVAMATTITLTEGFRQTCISFDLSLTWGEAPHPCSKNYEDRDNAYDFQGLHTFELILTGLVCGWISVILTIIIVLLNATRARLCSCACV